MSGGKKDALIWCDLVHLGTEMWARTYSTLQFDETVWNRYIDRMVERKLNAVLIDLSKSGADRPGDPERFKQLAYVKLDEAGFDQICCGSTWNNDTNFGDTVKFCREVVAPQRLKGFLNASWAEPCPKDMEKGLRAIDQVGAELCKIV